MSKMETLTKKYDDVEYTFKVQLPETMAEAIDMWGNARCFDLAVGAAKIAMRSVFVGMMTRDEDAKSAKQVGKIMETWKFGPLGSRGDPVGTALRKVTKMTDEQKREIIEGLQAQVGDEISAHNEDADTKA